jgi:hypothetical protein
MCAACRVLIGTFGRLHITWLAWDQQFLARLDAWTEPHCCIVGFSKHP